MILPNFKKVKRKKGINNHRVPLISNQDPNPLLVEALRTLLANLRYCNPGKPLKSLLITSTGAQEGKSTTVANLAILLAQEGSKVLLVDADLRAPKQNLIFKVSKYPGLSELLMQVSNTQISRGSLDNFSVGDAFQLIKIQRKNGVFSIEKGDMNVSFYFKDGQVVETHWKDLHTKKNLAEVFKIKSGTFQFQETNSLNELTDYTDNTETEEILQKNIPQVYRQPFLEKSTASYLKTTHIKNLSLLTSGHLPPNPSQLLSSESMNIIIKMLQHQFDAIIFDTPPAGIISDVFSLITLVDGIILVIRKGFLDKNFIKKTKEKLEMGNANICGVVFNQTDLKTEGYYYNYGD